MRFYSACKLPFTLEMIEDDFAIIWLKLINTAIYDLYFIDL
jgi:hypothetical protein